MFQLNFVYLHKILEMPLLVLVLHLTFSLCTSPLLTLPQGLVQRKVARQATYEKEYGFLLLLFHVLNWILVIST